MTLAVAFHPAGNAVDMIDDMYDLFIAAHVKFGVAELRDGRQLFVLPPAPGIPVTEEDVLYELSSYLSTQGFSLSQMGDEITDAVIDTNP